MSIGRSFAYVVAIVGIACIVTGVIAVNRGEWGIAVAFGSAAAACAFGANEFRK